jgi:hypothetical protein
MCVISRVKFAWQENEEQQKIQKRMVLPIERTLLLEIEKITQNQKFAFES